MLSLFIDFKSPAAYLALQPALNLIMQYGLAVAWFPFAVKQPVIPVLASDTALDDLHHLAESETKGETHRRVRANQRQQMHKLYAELSNTEMHFPTQPTNTDLALNVLANLTVDPTTFIVRAFTAYWVEQRDLNDATVVEQLVRDVGLPFTAELLLPTSRDACLDQAEAKGIFEVPAFVLNDQVFIGREHMPWLAEIAAEMMFSENTQA
jgi:2-hydroxychromene-2-carboxylate isomerase